MLLKALVVSFSFCFFVGSVLADESSPRKRRKISDMSIGGSVGSLELFRRQPTFKNPTFTEALSASSGTTVVSDESRSNTSSASSSSLDTLTPSFLQVLREAKEILTARPLNEWIVGNRFDIDLFFAEKDRNLLPIYRALLVSILRREVQKVYRALVLNHLDLTRWIFNRASGHFLTYFHLVFIYFPLADFKALMAFFDPKMLFMPCSNGINLMGLAVGLNDEAKRDYLRPILSAHLQELQELQARFRESKDS